jgi:hypothetical protein
MKRYKIAVLDDYQNAAIGSTDWSVLHHRADIAVFQDHLADREAVIERLLPFDVICVMRERSRCLATSLSVFPEDTVSNIRKWLDTR